MWKKLLQLCEEENIIVNSQSCVCVCGGGGG